MNYKQENKWGNNIISRDNNFDLIRLLAALQVLLGLGINLLNLQESCFGIISMFSFFPGVLIFFVISGFLITRSFTNCYNGGDRNRNIKQYIKNRFLRVFPALWLSFLLLLLLLLGLKVINLDYLTNSRFLIWMLGQVTIFQYYTPDILRSFGVGTPNGSLWTIPVELEFYILLPLFFLFSKRVSVNVKFLILFFMSILFNMFWTANNEERVFDKLIGVSVFPYLYSFLLGGILFLNWNKLRWITEGRFWYWCLIYFGYCYLFDASPSYHLDTWNTLLANFLLCVLTISVAFTGTKLGKTLRGNDISYGMYIYHMLVINVFVQLGFVGNISYLLYVLVITIIVSILSWQFIEKKALLLKYK